jgi:hypothetical protein
VDTLIRMTEAAESNIEANPERAQIVTISFTPCGITREFHCFRTLAPVGWLTLLKFGQECLRPTNDCFYVLEFSCGCLIFR